MTQIYSARGFYDPYDNHAAFSGAVRRFKQALGREHGVGPVEQQIYLGGEKELPCCAPAATNGKAWNPTPEAWGFVRISYKKFAPEFSLEISAFICEVRVSTYRYIDYAGPGIYSPNSNFEGSQQNGSGNRYMLSQNREGYVFLREAKENAPLVKSSENPVLCDVEIAETIVAEGLFDLDYNTYTLLNIWAMRVTNIHGLLLELQLMTETHKRIGVFRI